LIDSSIEKCYRRYRAFEAATELFSTKISRRRDLQLIKCITLAI